LQELPLAFFNQNKTGDLISRINNDTDKLNQFFSQSLMQFVGSIFMMVGSGVFLLTIDPLLGAAAVAPALFLLLFTRAVSPWVKRRNALSLKGVGQLSAEIQESLQHFKVIVAFNRRDYFRSKFDRANRENYSLAIQAGFANTLFIPVFGLCSQLAQLIVLGLGIYLISVRHFTLGLLIGYLAYVYSFYNPLRQLAALWTNFQVALAGWDRISQILVLQSDMPQLRRSANSPPPPAIRFRDVSFAYAGGKAVLEKVNFSLVAGKTYAFVGPTGGGKTTTASLMARLFDPQEGEIILQGRDIRSYPMDDRCRRVGFILQEPYLFGGTIRENILYGNESYQQVSDEELTGLLHSMNLENLFQRLGAGLDAKIQSGSDGISLGQKQLIAFLRAVLRKPEILILDEATANIDTVTEKLLEEIVRNLPKETVRVIIAHRLNTIANADEIFFVNSGQVLPAGSLANALDMLLHQDRKS
jgi:ATP-binding cassette subfamily B protein